MSGDLDLASAGVLECHRCGDSECYIEVQFHQVRPDVWQPVCEACHAEMQATADEVNQHEMSNFGGAYGLVEWLTRIILPQQPEGDPHA